MTSVHPIFARDGSLDFDGLARLIDHAIEAGSGTMLLTYGASLHSILSDADKRALQQYITRCYGSLTTFNVLFDAREDWFVGEKKSE